MSAPSPTRTLRRSTTDRVAAGVAGGLGEYFGVDPIVFRVLFAVSAFFGGAGLIAYAIGWALIPSAGTERATLDQWITRVRTSRIPTGLIVAAAVFVLWGVAASWWSSFWWWGGHGPHAFWPLVGFAVLAVLIARLAQRVNDGKPPAPPVSPVPPTSPVPPAPPSVASDAMTAEMPVAPEAPAAAWAPPQSRPQIVTLVTLVVLVATLTILGICDAVGGIILPVYFWVTGGIVLVALLTGALLRRTPWALTPLLVLSLIGMIAFGGTRASLHDGSGAKTWAPTSDAQLQTSYRLAFGQGVLDLRELRLTSDRTISVQLAAGQVRILLPPAANATVYSNVRFGDVQTNGVPMSGFGDGWRNHGGVSVSTVSLPPANATGPALTINVHVADGNVAINR